MSRASKFTDKLAAEICDRLAQGEPLTVICEDEDMPAWRTVYDWKDKNADLSAAIARAREVGHDTIAANTRRVAKGDDGFSSGDVQRDKLIVETDLKLLAKWDPKRYGERQTLEHSVSVPEELAAWLNNRA